jgi:hypothetical protein
MKERRKERRKEGRKERKGGEKKKTIFFVFFSPFIPLLLLFGKLTGHRVAGKVEAGEHTTVVVHVLGMCFDPCIVRVAVIIHVALSSEPEPKRKKKEKKKKTRVSQSKRQRTASLPPPFFFLF